jgi:CBS domain-containing protein
MKVQEVMTTKVESVAPNASLRQAARKMGELKVGSLAVMKDDQLLGLVTDRDISCHAVAMGRDANATDVQKIMIKEVTTCYTDQEIAEAAQLMADHHIRRLAVIDRDNKLSGWISVDDLARVSRDLAGTVLEAATPIH